MEFIKLNENDNVQLCIIESSKVFKFGHKYATQKKFLLGDGLRDILDPRLRRML